MIDACAIVHDQAHVRNASIGAGTRIWQFASVIRGAVVGENCVIGSCAIVDCATLGNDCRVGHGAQLHPGFRAMARVFIGPGAVVCNDLWPTVEKEGFDLEECFRRPVVIAEPGASIGANAVVLPGVVLGEGSLVAAGAVCCASVPAGHVFHRGGIIAPIPAGVRRMRFAA